MDTLHFEVIALGSQAYAQTLALRNEVLRAPLNLQLTAAELDSDKDFIHIAGFQADALVATAGLSSGPGLLKMRQVAIAAHVQGQGIGTALLAYCETQARQRNAPGIYAHARQSALPFYQNSGYALCSDLFFELNIPHKRVEKVW